jgi:hypothetical protein
LRFGSQGETDMARFGNDCGNAGAVALQHFVSSRDPEPVVKKHPGR